MDRGIPEAENGAGANKSVVWDGSEGVEVESREVPSPGPGELRVRVEASGLCGTDLHIASGEYPSPALVSRWATSSRAPWWG